MRVTVWPAFVTWKREVCRQARQVHVLHLVPGDNDLYRWWEQHTEVARVVAFAASRRPPNYQSEVPQAL